MKKLIAIGLSVFALETSAYFASGNDLATVAQNFTNDTGEKGLYLGLVLGAASVYARPETGAYAICYPPNATGGQIAKVTAKYLEDHPEELHYSADLLIWASHLDAFGKQDDPSCWKHDAWLKKNS